MDPLLSKEGRSGTQGTMKAHLCLREVHVLLVLHKRDRSVHHVTIHGEDARRLADAGLQKLLLGEGDPGQHIAVGRALVLLRRCRNPLRMLKVRLEAKRCLRGSVVLQEGVKRRVPEDEHILFVAELVVVQLHELLQKGVVILDLLVEQGSVLAPLLEVGA